MVEKITNSAYRHKMDINLAHGGRRDYADRGVYTLNDHRLAYLGTKKDANGWLGENL